ncbi:MAG TPA: hypothetical protein VEH49_06405 [Methylomirabilota bacterium]|nr:hypothetical protein [Methylomirabilota bacterium]
MRNRIIGMGVVLCLLGAAGLASLALGQSSGAEKPVIYTYVSEWTVPRGMWAAYQKIDDADNELLGKTLNEGTISSWGSFTTLTHQEGEPTHGSWFSARSMAALMKTLEALRATPGATDAVLGASKHWDFILQSRDYNYHPGTFKNGYLRVGRWNRRPGSSDPDGKIMKSTLVASLEKLLADGALHFYSVDEETIHTEDPGTFWIVIITNGPEGLDKFNAAIEEMGRSNPAGIAGFQGLIEGKGHRDFLARVNTVTYK